MDAIWRAEKPGDLGRCQDVGRFGDGAGRLVPEGAGGLSLRAAGVDGPAAEEGGHIVEHDGDDDLVGAGVDFEDAWDGAPDHAADYAGDKGKGQVDKDGQAFEVDAHGDGEYGAHGRTGRRRRC